VVRESRISRNDASRSSARVMANGLSIADKISVGLGADSGGRFGNSMNELNRRADACRVTA
jgi:hypothetical protein